MPKFYIICGDARAICEAKNAMEAACKMFNQCLTRNYRLSNIVWVNETGFPELKDNTDESNDDVFISLEEIIERL